MSSLNNRIQSFHLLGEYLRLFCDSNFKGVQMSKLSFQNNEQFVNIQNSLVDYIENSTHYNAWFTKESLEFSLKEWAGLLKEEHLQQWMSLYEVPDIKQPKTIGVVMAGNIPMVGFHDYLSVLLSGHRLLAKLSSGDTKLIPLLNSILELIDAELAQMAQFTTKQLKNFDAIIATGSNNTARYFEYYFGKHPHIIRKNRNGVAILTGEETKEQLSELAKDIFVYFGLGCRNVSKLFVPQKYEFKKLFESFEYFNKTQFHSKYFNNYEYQKAIYLVNKTHHRDNGFLLLKEDAAYASPIGVLYYEEYDNDNDLIVRLEADKEQIQCIVGHKYLPYGETQKPQLNDYADGVDTMSFLLSLSI